MNNKLAVFILVYTESENPLTEASIDINDDQVEIFCSSEMDCLALIYGCSNSEILRILYISSNNKTVTTIAPNLLHSVAFFGINTGEDQPLQRYPGKVMNDVGVGSSAASTSVDSVFLFCAMCLLLQYLQ